MPTPCLKGAQHHFKGVSTGHELPGATRAAVGEAAPQAGRRLWRGLPGPGLSQDTGKGPVTPAANQAASRGPWLPSKSVGTHSL